MIVKLIIRVWDSISAYNFKFKKNDVFQQLVTPS